MAWSHRRHQLWRRDARRQVRALLLMLQRGRELRSRPEEDPRDLFAHALPVDVGLWVLQTLGQSWLRYTLEVRAEQQEEGEEEGEEEEERRALEARWKQLREEGEEEEGL